MRKRILVVEHELEVAESLDRQLRQRGYRPVLMASAGEASARFTEIRPDLVVISLTLPDDGGRGLCREVRGQPLGALVPILFLGSGREEVRTVSEAIAAGADHFFVKPTGIDALLGKVTTYIGRGDEGAPLPTPTPGAAADDGALLAALAREDTDARLAAEAAVADANDPLFSTISEVLASGAPEPETPTRPGAELSLGETRPELRVVRPFANEPTLVDTPRLSPHTTSPEPGPDPRELPATASAPAGPAPARQAPRTPPAPTSPAPMAPPSAALPLQGQADPPPAFTGPTKPAPLSSPAASATPGGLPAPESRMTAAFGARPPAEVTSERVPALAPRPELGAAPSGDSPLETGWPVALKIGCPVALAIRGVAEILAAAHGTGLSGRAEISSTGALRRVFFDRGHPVFADSSDPGEDLAAWLVADGHVTRAMLNDARDRAEASGGTAEEHLIEAGWVNGAEVHAALRPYVTEGIMGLFSLEVGEAVVYRGGPGPMDPVDLAVHPGRLVLDGVRRKYGRLRLYRLVGTPALSPRLRVGGRPPSGLDLREEEESIRRGVDARRTVTELAQAAAISDLDALAIIAGLCMLGVVERPTGTPLGEVAAPERATLARRAAAPRTADQMPGYAERVAHKLTEARTADYFAVLGVPRSATGAEVRAAWERLRRLFDPHAVQRDSPLWHHVVEIADVVDDAYAVLSVARFRTRYEQNLD